MTANRSDTTVDVTVVIPHYEQHAQLALTLEALNHQTYPPERLQVVVADDGSSMPVAEPATVGFDLVIRSQVHQGFGLARARNLGADAADGDVVVFLDADMLPEPQFVAAHLGAVVHDEMLISIGHRLHVDVAGLTTADVARALGSGTGLDRLFGPRPRSEPGWRADHLMRTNDLRGDLSEPYRIASGGNLSLWRQFYWDCGGTDPSFRQWGGEDLEFAFRATQHGARFVYTRHALAWHQGLESVTDDGERRSQADQRPLLANRIADRHLRDDKSGRVFTVPHLSVEIMAAEMAALEIEVLTDGLLRHPLGCVVRITGVPRNHVMSLQHAFVDDPRVDIGDVPVLNAPPSLVSPAPLQAFIDMRQPVAAAAVLAAVERLTTPPRVGVVRVGGAAVYNTELAARVGKRSAQPAMTKDDLVAAMAREAGEDRIDSASVAPERVPGTALDGADTLRDVWWRLSPRQRRSVERAARTASAGIARVRRLRGRPR